LKQWLTPEERRAAAVVIALVGAGYLMLGWRVWREPDPPFPLDSLDLAFMRTGAALAADSGAPSGAGPAAASLAGPTQALDLNHADSLALLELPGIGPTKAGGILAWRRRHGAFRRVEDLMEVPGIGPATFARLQGQVGIGSDKVASGTPASPPQPAGAGRRDAK
jgi:competence ComEA-like helix-hairpin-helix protein